MKKLLLLSSICLSIVSVVTVNAKIDEAFLGYKLLAEKEKDVTLYPVKKAELLEFDTFQFTLKGTQEQKIKAIVAALIAPETTTNKKFKTQFSKDGEDRLEALFKEATLIEVEVLNDEEKDEHDRYLVNVWLDGVLLQEILLSEGLASFEEPKVKDYPYVQALWDSQDYAQRYQVAIWESYSTSNDTQSYTAPVGFSSNTNGNYSSNSGYSQNSSSQNSNQSYSEPVLTEAEVYVPEETVAPAASVYYPNCSAARAAGAAPVYVGEPGYGTHLDRDGDGIGCE